MQQPCHEFTFMNVHFAEIVMVFIPFFVLLLTISMNVSSPLYITGGKLNKSHLAVQCN